MDSHVELGQSPQGSPNKRKGVPHMIWGEGRGEGEQDTHNPMLSMFQKGKVPQTTQDPGHGTTGCQTQGHPDSLPGWATCCAMQANGSFSEDAHQSAQDSQPPAALPDGSAEEGRTRSWPGPSAQVGP